MTSHDPACPWKGDPHDCPFHQPADEHAADGELARVMRQRPDGSTRQVRGAGHYE